MHKGDGEQKENKEGRRVDEWTTTLHSRMKNEEKKK